MDLQKLARKFKKATGIEKAIGSEGKDAEFIRKVRKQFATADEAEQDQVKLELSDLAFCDPDKQWPDEIKSEREADGRPCLVEDHLGPFIHQVTNEQRQNRPSVQVNPVDDGADVETAETLQGLVRHIEYDSSADQAYDTAFESMVRCGRGFYRVITEFSDPESFVQDIKIKRIPNHFLVKMDPSAVELDFSDAEWGGIKEYMTKEAYEKAYPDSELAAYATSDWESISDEAPEWMGKDGQMAMVVEYFWKEYKKVKIARLSDGTVKDLSDLPDGTKEGSDVDGLTVDSIRETNRPQVKWAKLNAVEVLERGDWAGKWIPIIPVLGTELQINGKRTWSGLIRSAKDAQRRINYFISAQSEIIALAPRTPYIGPRGFMGTRVSQWSQANRKSFSALEYEAYDAQDRPLNPPQRTDYNPPIQAVTAALQLAEQGLKSSTGMFDASLGQREASQSGVAIRSLQQQGATSNFHFQDALSRAIKHEGRILIDLIPKIYDTPRTIRVVGEDQTSDTVKINEPIMHKGKPAKFDLTTGTYDVTVSAGPSYQTKRSEAVASMTAMVQAHPPLFEVVGDLLVRSMDWPGAAQIADRLKKMLPPQLQEAPEGAPNQGQIPPQVQQALQMAQQKDQQSGQMIEQMTAKIHELMDQIEDNQAKADAEMQKAILDNQTKKEIAQMNCEKDLLIAETQVLGAGAMPELKAKIAELEHNHEELAELALAHHDVLAAGPQAPPEPVEAAEPQPDPIHGILQQHGMALDSIGKALHRLGGPKKLVMDATGRPIGVAPDESGE